MIPFPGWVLTRAIPLRTMTGVISGAYRVGGGVIRNNASGRIVAHLIEGSNAINMASSVVPGLNSVVSGINTVQLYRIGRDLGQVKESVAALQKATAHLTTLAQGTLALSGLTLTVSAAGFVFMHQKLRSLEKKLDALSKEVRGIRTFLELGERGRLAAALKNLENLDETVPSKTRDALLVQSRQVLGEVYEKYREVYAKATTTEEAEAAEQYFAVTAIAHAVCSAELEMFRLAAKELSEACANWEEPSKRIAKDILDRSSRKWFFNPLLTAEVPFDEICEWHDFANSQTTQPNEYVDKFFRPTENRYRPYHTPAKPSEKREIEFVRRVSARSRILEGYKSQVQMYAQHGLRPSQVRHALQKAVEAKKNKQFRVNECFVLVPQASS